MVRIKKLIELMDNPAEYTVTYDAGIYFAANFNVDDVVYRAEIIEGEPYEEGEYEIIFDVKSKGPRGMDILGTGNAATVFSTVAAIIKDHFQRHKSSLKAYIIGAKEDSRRKLYKRFAQMMKSELKFTKVETEMDDGQLIFIIRR